MRSYTARLKPRPFKTAFMQPVPGMMVLGTMAENQSGGIGGKSDFPASLNPAVAKASRPTKKRRQGMTPVPLILFLLTLLALP
jgi:hypothetical protein